jgi:hypothetical protein
VELKDEILWPVVLALSVPLSWLAVGATTVSVDVSVNIGLLTTWNYQFLRLDNTKVAVAQQQWLATGCAYNYMRNMTICTVHR